MNISKLKNVTIGRKKIGYGEPCFVIAEAGVNHNGKLASALQLVDAAAKAGAHAIKFQTFKASQVVTKKAATSAYQQKNTEKKESQLDLLGSLELKEEYYPKIIKRCKSRGIIFLSTPHGGFESVDFLQKLNVPAFKFGSGDLTNLPLLQYAAKFKKPIILGTGIGTLTEVQSAIHAIKKSGNNKIIALHATTSYPCPRKDVNLRAMETMIQKLDVLVGYSDHTLGIQTSIMAATLGACVIEKHFTLDKKMHGPDHKASLEPDELRQMISGIRDVEVLLGLQVKKATKREEKVKKSVRKSIVARVNIYKGDIFCEKNIALKRPGNGLEPCKYFKLLGKVAKQNIKSDNLITQKDYA